ncbi:phosphodiester glycosidase family protein [Herbidospora galbida]|uniref:Phosphodiester glycosidase family protein n=1 Tax=Herbidospora galbida TaxID=2575442 RepID=A0A4V5V0L3_9ACTN|nr:phosphodiester glycosidase family protein [Herbidospora galbida]
MRGRLTVAITALASLLPVMPVFADSQKTTGLPSSSFPLGVPGLAKTTSKMVIPGIEYITLRHGTNKDGYTVSVLAGANDAFTQRTAEKQALAVQMAGFEPVVVKFTRPAIADYPAQDYWMVRVGQWPLSEKKEADKVVKELKKAGVSAKADYTGDDGFVTAGPWSMKILMVDPRSFRGSFAASLGKKTAVRERVTDMAKGSGAIAGVNGGFFDIHTGAAYRGDPTGISVVGGKLLSEAVEGRTAVVLKGRTARITELKSAVNVAAGGALAPVAGVNRVGKDGELVLYTEEFGASTPKVGATEVVIDPDGVVTAVRSPGAKIMKGMRVLQGVGAGADWLAAYAPEGGKVQLKTTVTDLRKKRTVPLTPDTHIVGGGVGLVKNGKTWITASTDGMANINMIVRRHPRTLAGVTRNGKLILAVVDGRAPGQTVGASFHEAARVMQWLGARDAINLDGGGSSAMVVKGKVVNKPSDGAERAVGDALLIKP